MQSDWSVLICLAMLLDTNITVIGRPHAFGEIFLHPGLGALLVSCRDENLAATRTDLEFLRQFSDGLFGKSDLTIGPFFQFFQKVVAYRGGVESRRAILVEKYIPFFQAEKPFFPLIGNRAFRVSNGRVPNWKATGAISGSSIQSTQSRMYQTPPAMTMGTCFETEIVHHLRTSATRDLGSSGISDLHCSTDHCARPRAKGLRKPTPPSHSGNLW